MSDLPEATPQLLAARKALAASKQWGSAVERGILSGAWDTGEAMRAFMVEVPADEE